MTVRDSESSGRLVRCLYKYFVYFVHFGGSWRICLITVLSLFVVRPRGGGNFGWGYKDTTRVMMWSWLFLAGKIMDALAFISIARTKRRLIARLDRCVFVIFLIQQRSLDPELTDSGSCRGERERESACVFVCEECLSVSTHHSCYTGSILPTINCIKEYQLNYHQYQ
jgi:hypothetical protein